MFKIIGVGSGVLIAVSALIQISPIKINPWTHIARAIGRAINGELTDKITRLESNVTALREQVSEQAATECRARILRFGDEVLHRERHTKEHFDQILRDIDTYENYCRTHPRFENHITALTSSRIIKIYEECCGKGEFL